MTTPFQLRTGTGIDVAGLGASTLDALTTVDQFPGGEGDENRGVQAAGCIALQGGGPIATAMATVARLGGRAAIIDALGDDWIGARILAEFAQCGVDTSAVIICPGATSAFSNILVRERDGERHIIFARGTAGEFPADRISRDLICNAAVLHLNGRHFEACRKAIEIAREHGTLVSFDGGKGRFRSESLELLPQVDIAILSLDFATQLLAAAGGSNERVEDPHEITTAIRRSLDIALIVLTDGARGSWIDPAGADTFHQPAFPVAHVVDTTGCGDVYHGAFLFALAKEMPLAECASLASAAAAISATALGGRGRLPTLEELQCDAGVPPAS